MQRLVALGDVIALAIVNNLVHGLFKEVLDLRHRCRRLLVDLRSVVHYLVARHLDLLHLKGLAVSAAAQALQEHLLEQEHPDLFHLGEAGCSLLLGGIGQVFFASDSLSGERHDGIVITLL